MVQIIIIFKNKPLLLPYITSDPKFLFYEYFQVNMVSATASS